MKKNSLPFYVFAALFVLTLPLSFDNFSFDFATSVIPGWHTTIYPPYLLMNLVVSFILLFVIIAYWKLSKKRKAINPAVFIIHIVLTIPSVFYIVFPLFVESLLIRDNGLVSFPLFISVIFAPYLVFVIGQAFFFVYYFRSIKANASAM